MDTLERFLNKSTMSIEVVKVNTETNNQSVTLSVSADYNLSDYLLYDETFNEDGSSNLDRFMYRFPKLSVKAGDSVTLYVNDPENEKAKKIVALQNHHRLFWGGGRDVFNQQNNERIHLIKIATSSSFDVPVPENE